MKETHGSYDISSDCSRSRKVTHRSRTDEISLRFTSETADRGAGMLVYHVAGGSLESRRRKQKSLYCFYRACYSVHTIYIEETLYLILLI